QKHFGHALPALKSPLEGDGPIAAIRVILEGHGYLVQLSHHMAPICKELAAAEKQSSRLRFQPRLTQRLSITAKMPLHRWPRHVHSPLQFEKPWIAPKLRRTPADNVQKQ